MKRTVINVVFAGLVAMLGFSMCAINTYAEDGAENTEEEAPKTSLTITPVSKTLQISSNSSYDGTMNVTNDGTADIKIEVHASPYSYVYSGEEDAYKLGFNNENNFTQISRWITIKDSGGNYVNNPVFSIKAGETLSIDYKITTPKDIPAGGQYAVIFAQTMSGSTNASGIRTEASAGMIIYGHSTEGETKILSEVRDMKVEYGVMNSGAAGENEGHNSFYGSAKVKNTGNVDFFVKGKLKIDPIIGFSSYETPSDKGTISVIPESERVIEDEWTESPGFGIYKATWTVTSGSNSEEKIERIIVVNPVLLIFIIIIVLTIVVAFIIIGVKKRKERRSRLAI